MNSAQKANLNLADVIKTLFNLGLMVTKNDFLDKDSIEILAEEFHLEISVQNTLEKFEVEKVLEGVKKSARLWLLSWGMLIMVKLHCWIKSVIKESLTRKLGDHSAHWRLW